MSVSRHVLVTGATGQQGGAVVRALLAKNHKVRGLTRKADSPATLRLREQGVEVVIGDLMDRAALENAARDVDAAYAMTSPFEVGTEEETQQGITLIEAAAAAGVGHLVLSSVANADQNTGIPHFDSKYRAEQHLASSGVPYTISAPVYFMENLLSPWMLPQVREGTMALAMPADRPLQQITLDDIGAFAVSLIERRDAVFGKRYDIAGDELTGARAAEILSTTSGRTIRFQSFSLDTLRQQSGDMATMFEWIDRVGYSADIRRLRHEFPEVGWHRFETWARQQEWRILDD